ncbi:MAG: NADH-quinone oxidoreductase subunit C [Opitutae bacterium]|nr:NADH-quinone oxidoreductase subunit C [Opitutae bacterium]
METAGQIRDRLLARFPGATISLLTNPGPAAEHSLLVDAAHGRAIALFLRDDPALQLDYCSNATGVDSPEKEIVETKKVSTPDPAGGPAKITEEKTTRTEPGYIEAVYHLYSMALRHGPVVIRMRTANRSDQVTLPSLTPVWRSCDFQEREIFDLYGIVFAGHPDLRRILMWDEFKDHPMRKDYVEPDDYEWEPTPHNEVLDRAKTHFAAPAASAPANAPAAPSTPAAP